MATAGKSLSTAIFFLALSGCSRPQPLLITDPWVRPSSAGENSAAYFVIQNSDTHDRLLSVESALASETQIHATEIDEEGIARMQELKVVTLQPNSTTAFQPGGLHLMLVNLQHDLKAGESIDLQFEFENHDPITVQAEIRSQ